MPKGAKSTEALNLEEKSIHYSGARTALYVSSRLSCFVFVGWI